jgi:hypothetical protein
MTIFESLKSLDHHAYCIVGNSQSRLELTSILEKKHKIRMRGNPDLFDRAYETFLIDDAREVKASAGMKPVTAGTKKIFILTMNGITVEAQNALLKILEEPPEYAHFFLIIPSAHLLLPTVKSRISMIEAALRTGSKDAMKNHSAGESDEFLRLAPAKRLDFVKKLMDDIAKDDSQNRPRGKRPKQDAIDFLNSLEDAIRDKGLKGNVAKLEAIEIARRYMNDRSPSLKMLLEFVAMNL